jgi:hypothetical protein
MPPEPSLNVPHYWFGRLAASRATQRDVVRKLKHKMWGIRSTYDLGSVHVTSHSHPLCLMRGAIVGCDHQWDTSHWNA